MTWFIHFVGAGNRSLSVLLGLVMLAFAASVVLSGNSPAGLAEWILETFGITFLLFLSAMVLTVIFCWIRMVETAVDPRARRVWYLGAQHAANGAATIALTYTLLGISLGIGTLSGQELNQDTVQGVISGLTGHFSLAFMTTVVGLPTSAVLRAIVSVTEAKLEASEPAGPAFLRFKGDAT